MSNANYDANGNGASSSIHQLRKSYDKGELLLSQTPFAPDELFSQWMADAVEHCSVTEPNCMTVATVDSSMRPSTRIVLLKGFDANGLVFYTNYHSKKGQQLAGNPHIAAQFFWPELERQVRIEGTVKPLTAEQNQTYFSSRPRGSQLGAMASPQSTVIDSREYLDSALEALTAQHNNTDPLPCPPHWGGYCITPQYWEFWQGRPNRLHDRVCYQHNGQSWTKQRLAP